jgi:L-malate glycosyltransferase
MSKGEHNMHVLVVSTWYPVISKTSGIFIVEQAEALAKCGLKMGHIFARLEGLRTISRHNIVQGLPKITRIDGLVSVLGFSSWAIPAPRKLQQWFTTLALRRLFGRYVRLRGKPDILHGHVGAETGDALRSIAKQYDIPFIITEHSSAILLGAGDPGHGEYLKNIYEGACAVVPVSSSLATVLKDAQAAQNLVEIPNMVGESAFSQKRSRIASNIVRIIIIGSLVPLKRVDFALRAISAVQSAMRLQVEVVIVGDGPEAASLKRQASLMDVKVEFCGAINHQAALRQIAEADVLLHASAVETFGIVLIEAMAMGLPVIASRSGGPDAIVMPKSGYLIDIADQAGMTKAIEDVVCNISQWRVLGPSITQHVKSLYSQDSVTIKIIELYEKLCKKL